MKSDLPSRALALVLSAASSATPPAAFADDRPQIVTIGLWTIGQRVAPGAEEFDFALKPIIDIRDADATPRLHLPGDNGGPTLFRSGAFHLGPSLNFVASRKAGDDPAFRGLGDVDWAFEAGVFAELWLSSHLRTRVEVRRGFNGHEGVVANLAADLVVRPTSHLTLSIGPRVELGNAEYVSTYFGVSTAQAATSGLAAFEAGGGLVSTGVAGSAAYVLNREWTLLGYIETGRLLGDAGDSPITRRGTGDLVTFGGGLTYSFAIDRHPLAGLGLGR